VVPLAGIAPGLVRKVYDLCREERFVEARGMQEDIAHLHHLVKEAGSSGLKDGLAGIKCAMSLMGRECGVPRPPVKALGEVERGRLEETVRALGFLKTEPRGW
jgi:dihydrodipicolinate synthase/N-acetylneuraminate lyase